MSIKLNLVLTTETISSDLLWQVSVIENSKAICTYKFIIIFLHGSKLNPSLQ